MRPGHWLVRASARLLRDDLARSALQATLAGHPAEILRAGLPYLLGGAVLGWMTRPDLGREAE